jgi:hypothetical protein
MSKCYKQGQHSKKEIEYCTKVIERASYLTNTDMLAKAYLRRGFAYEHMEKLKEAREDLTRVRELEPGNF